jgi:hypothetical protein
MSNLEITKMLVLSTGHLTEDSGNTTFFDRWSWIVWVPNEQLEDYPSDLLQAFDLARNNGCDWIKFDSDGGVVDELPNYDW